MPRVARPAPSDHAPSPFESLIEDTSQPAAPPPPQPDSKVVKSDEKEAPAKSKDCKPAEPNDDTQTANADEGISADQAPADETTSKADDKKIVKPETVTNVSDSIQTKADPEPDPGQKTNDANVAPATDGILTITSSDAVSIVPTIAQMSNVTPDDSKQVEQPLQQLAVVADTIPNKLKLLGEDLPKAADGKKAVDGKGKQVDGVDQIGTDQPATETDDAFETLTKDAALQRADGKPQAEPGDDKQRVPQVRSDAVASSHRPDVSEPTAAGGTDLSGTMKVSTDTTTQLPIPNTTTHSTANTAAATAPTAQPTPQPMAVPLSGVAVEIAGKALAGKNRFEIRLDPPELGRIEVRLDVDRDGNVTSRLTVDRPDTLDLLRRDAAGLERALQDAGLKTANNGLQFSLRDQSMNEQQAGPSPGAAVLVASDESLPPIDVIPQPYRVAGQGGGLDIRV